MEKNLSNMVPALKNKKKTVITQSTRYQKESHLTKSAWDGVKGQGKGTPRKGIIKKAF